MRTVPQVTRRADDPCQHGIAPAFGRRWWPRRCGSIARVLTAFGTLGATFASPGITGASAASGPEFFGTNLQTLGSVKVSERPRVLDALRDGRMVVNRIEVRWDESVEPKAPAANQVGCAGHTYAWGGVDGQVRMLAEKGLRAAPIFRYTPGWAKRADPSKPGGVDEFPPSAYDDFGCMIGAFAKRYGDPPGAAKGAFWVANPKLEYRPTLTYELWNEVNLDEYAWNHDANPEVYAAMAKVAGPIIREALPGAIVLGDLAYQENEVPDYVPRLGKAGGLAALDAMGYHPYAPDAEETLRLVEHLRAQLTVAGFPGMPIYANEAGQEAVVTNPDGTLTPNRPPSEFAHSQFPSDAARAANLAFAGEALAASNCGVEQFLPYSASGNERDGEKLTESYMGLFRPATGAPTLTAAALIRASHRWAARFDAGGPGAPAPLALCGGGESPEASVLPIDSTFTSSSSGCITLTATYDGHPLEAVSLRLLGPTGQQVAVQKTSAFGVATACIPYGTPVDGWSAVGQLDAAGRTGRVSCDVANVGCPVGAPLAPGRGSLSAAAALGLPAAGAAKPAASTPSAGCSWRSRARVVSFVPGKRARPAVARIRLLVKCETAPPKARVKFSLMSRPPGNSKSLRKVRTVWLQNGVERVVTLRGAFVNGHVVVAQHRPAPGSGIPSLRDSVTLRVSRPARGR